MGPLWRLEGGLWVHGTQGTTRFWGPSLKDRIDKALNEQRKETVSGTIIAPPKGRHSLMKFCFLKVLSGPGAPEGITNRTQ